MDYPGIEGFLGTRASLMLDVVFVAMFGVLPVLGWSIQQVRYRRRYLLHKRVQLALGTVLLVAVTLFEVDMQLNGWRMRAADSPYYPTTVNVSLAIHLFFAVPTAMLWVYVIVQALRRFPKPPLPGEHSRQHVLWGRIAAIELALTALTGWIFYWLAFVAA
jgi:uncharacterized membrane protein YozB (DUF420 family)